MLDHLRRGHGTVTNAEQYANGEVDARELVATIAMAPIADPQGAFARDEITAEQLDAHVEHQALVEQALEVGDEPPAHPLMAVELVAHVQDVANDTQSVAYHYHDCGDGSVLEVRCFPIPRLSGQPPEADAAFEGVLCDTGAEMLACRAGVDGDQVAFAWEPVDITVSADPSLTAHNDAIQ
jgi:hypothetical protein